MEQDKGYYTIKELLEMEFPLYEPIYCELNLDSLVVTTPKEFAGYEREFDLERYTTAAELLDALIQDFNKPWMTPELFSDLVNTIDRACEEIFGKDIQGVFCPFGKQTKVNWKKKTIK